MKRYIIPVLFLATMSQGWAAEGVSALTGKTLIDADVVTVGDLFTKPGKDKDYVLAPAPKTGEKLVLDKNDLMRVSDAFRLNWQPPAGLVVVTLERNASAVSENAIIAALNDSDLKAKISHDAQFKVTNLSDDVLVPGKLVPSLSISETHFNSATEEFSARLTIKDGETLLKTVELQGLATALVTVPAVKMIMTANTVITEDDLTEVQLPKKQIRDDAILSKADLVGMTIKRAVQPDQVISQADVMAPMLIKRNDLVNVSYRNGPILLSTKARALNNASRGEIVQLVNPSSKKSFEAKVTGPQQAEVNLEG